MQIQANTVRPYVFTVIFRPYTVRMGLCFYRTGRRLDIV